MGVAHRGQYVTITFSRTIRSLPDFIPAVDIGITRLDFRAFEALWVKPATPSIQSGIEDEFHWKYPSIRVPSSNGA
jgi:hypothetical protein